MLLLFVFIISVAVSAVVAVAVVVDVVCFSTHFAVGVYAVVVSLGLL